MVRPAKKVSERRRQVSIRLHPAIYEWIEGQVGPGLRWQSITHALEFAVTELRKREEK